MADASGFYSLLRLTSGPCNGSPRAVCLPGTPAPPSAGGEHADFTPKCLRETALVGAIDPARRKTSAAETLA